MARDATTTVFIVEDSADVRDALVDLLEDLDGVTIAGSAEDALTAIAAILRCRPNLVVLDYQLAGSTALDVLEAVHPVAPEIAFIVLTNHANTAYRRLCMKAGASGFLNKARDFEKVKDIVAQLSAPHITNGE
ncbi:MAG TPA: response regulator [Casimicrobiaceae bacterium]|nr:response regulator [Casimicrobiaceae bacterium]